MLVDSVGLSILDLFLDLFTNLDLCWKQALFVLSSSVDARRCCTYMVFWCILNFAGAVGGWSVGDLPAHFERVLT